MSEKVTYDEKLWFIHEGCEGKHYLLDNPHTYVGRMMAWCPVNQRSFFVSKPQIGDCSTEAEYWIKGFLVGNQPDPPVDEEGMVSFGSRDYEKWTKEMSLFNETGYWWAGEARHCENCKEELMRSQPQNVCGSCA